jgi:hypothetical protein
LWLWWELVLLREAFSCLDVKPFAPPLSLTGAEAQKRLLGLPYRDHYPKYYRTCSENIRDAERVFMRAFLQQLGHTIQRYDQGLPDCYVVAVERVLEEVPARSWGMMLAQVYLYLSKTEFLRRVLQGVQRAFDQHAAAVEPTTLPLPAHPERALVIGGAECVWDDVAAWEKSYGKQWDGVVIAANDVGSHWPRPLHHWCSCHPKKLWRWLATRRAYGFEITGVRLWGHCDPAVPKFRGGTSGLLAVHVAKALGCEKVVLCGVPLTATPHFGASKEHITDKQWRHQLGRTHRRWRAERDTVLQHARSMSGWTAAQLGKPTVEWLRGD